MPGPQFNEPQEERYTQWHNPLSETQYVDVREGDSPRPTRYTVPPGKTVPIPSRYDSVVHRVHNGVVIGGQAPQLVQVGSENRLDPAHDTGLQERERAKADKERAAFVKKQAEDEIVLAAAREREANAKAEARAKQPPAEPKAK
jgi:hypothetical protein